MENAANTAPYMGLISWIILGLIAGFIGSKIVNRRGEGIVRHYTWRRRRCGRWLFV